MDVSVNQTQISITGALEAADQRMAQQLLLNPLE
jgi:hypothetical protein